MLDRLFIPFSYSDGRSYCRRGNIISELLAGAITPWTGTILYVIVFAPIIYLGAHSVDRMNMVLMAGLFITYIILIGMAVKHVDISLISYINWSSAWMAIPILFTAFTYQVIVPTLVTYMDRNFKKVRQAIIIGSSIPLVIYLVWEFVILGIIPADGPEGLIHAGELGQTAIAPLKYFLNNLNLFSIGKYFAFFTMTVSYVALSLAFFDFLADGLKIKKVGYKKFILLLLIFIPPMIISLGNPDIFISALRYAGGISIAILFGLLPPLMVWIGRYVKKYPKMPYPLFGGKPLLGLLILLILIKMLAELFFQS